MSHSSTQQWHSDSPEIGNHNLSVTDSERLVCLITQQQSVERFVGTFILLLDTPAFLPVD